jgi:DNA-binding transcriptional MerR regulator
MDVDSLWTVGELAASAAAAIAAEGVCAANGRIREVPDVRTLRYYTTLGLLDRPQQMQGRTAYYGRRHLLQLVAIKRLQAAGQSLAEIQSRLVNLSDDELAALAKLPAKSAPADSAAEGASQPAPSPDTAGRTRTRFWAAAPNETPSAVQLAVGLSEEAALLFAAARTLTNEDLSAVRAAAQPLLEVLRQRRLL